MYVESNRDDRKSISLPEMSDSADFSANNIAQIGREDGEVLLREHPGEFSEHETSDDADSNED